MRRFLTHRVARGQRRPDASIDVAFAELNVRQAVPEWGNQPVQFALEEDVALPESDSSWIAPRQTQFYLVR